MTGADECLTGRSSGLLSHTVVSIIQPCHALITDILAEVFSPPVSRFLDLLEEKNKGLKTGGGFVIISPILQFRVQNEV